MTHDEMIAVIQAHKEGKKIQHKYKDSSEEWKDSLRPGWDFNVFSYRVKPEKTALEAIDAAIIAEKENKS